MALDKQIHLYAVDTGYFYSRKEARLHWKSYQLLREIQSLDPSMTNHEMLTRHKQKKAQEAKKKLQLLLKNKTLQNEQANEKHHIRTLNETSLSDRTVVSLFESSLTRLIGLVPNELTDALIIVQVYYFDLFRDLTFYGFHFRGEHYRYFTSSAGQIRQKKAVFIKDSLWQKHERSIMCGLTVDKINKLGGNNVNKHLAYMALTNSATEKWSDFDIEKSIVIDDFTTLIRGTCDYIDDNDYSVRRTLIDVPVTHTDGAGMVLPTTRGKNTMFRAPWIKGLLGVFDFRRFIAETGCSPVIKDIYGEEHNIVDEDIQIIFTKSQFKMHKYYESWAEYKTYFHQFGCMAGICNEEEVRIKKARINYQMLQTLTDVTPEEMKQMSSASALRIENLCASKENMLTALGVTPYTLNPTPFQQALKIYPALLADPYARDTLRSIKNSLLKKYRSGKLELDSKYTFILPDFYAACQHWFGHIPEPEGLLKDGEVYCRLFPQAEKLDCLRSPHLYKEHAVRKNIALSSACRSWFATSALYTSSFDLISKILQFDVDGDKALVVSDPDFIRIAERNMEDIVPLYYNMKKAAATPLTKETIYQGLISAFTGGNIGSYSNDIAKIWNNEVFLSGSQEEQTEALKLIKLLCCENNFVIDYAKTLYKPKRPKQIHKQLTRYTSGKLPAFFRFAKDKEGNQICEPNSSFVNRLADLVPNKAIRVSGLDLDKLNHHKLMSNPHTKCDPEVQAQYDNCIHKYRYKLHQKTRNDNNVSYVVQELKRSFLDLGYSEEMIADMLVQYLYGNEKRYKELLWFVFGDCIVRNLKKNLSPAKTKYIECEDCLEWIEVPSRSRSLRCPRCQALYRQQLDRKRKQK